MSVFTRKDILDINSLSREEIETIFNTARSFKEVVRRPVKKVPALRGKTVVNLFFEPSTRTKISFELAAKFLSADVINFSSSTSSILKGESLIDTLRNIQSLSADIFVVRDSSCGTPYILSRQTFSSVINAGDGTHAHPTQALLDMFTVLEKKGTLERLNVLIVGDILHSRVARSNIEGFRKFGCKVSVCGPANLLPFYLEDTGVSIFYNLDKAIKDQDVVIMLRLQKERQEKGFIPSLREYVQLYSLTQERFLLLKEGALVMHPGPVNWDVEIASALKRKVHPLVLKQVNNGLCVRMALLYLLSGGHETIN